MYSLWLTEDILRGCERFCLVNHLLTMLAGVHIWQQKNTHGTRWVPETWHWGNKWDSKLRIGHSDQGHVVDLWPLTDSTGKSLSKPRRVNLFLKLGSITKGTKRQTDVSHGCLWTVAALPRLWNTWSIGHTTLTKPDFSADTRQIEQNGCYTTDSTTAVCLQAPFVSLNVGEIGDLEVELIDEHCRHLGISLSETLIPAASTHNTGIYYKIKSVHLANNVKLFVCKTVSVIRQKHIRYTTSHASQHTLHKNTHVTTQNAITSQRSRNITKHTLRITTHNVTTHWSHHNTHVTLQHRRYVTTHFTVRYVTTRTFRHNTRVRSQHTCSVTIHMLRHNTNVTSYHRCVRHYTHILYI